MLKTFINYLTYDLILLIWSVHDKAIYATNEGGERTK